jgi:hypothetical protein
MRQHVIRRLLKSARRLRVKARRLPRPWPFIRLVAARPRTRASARDEVTLREPAAEETRVHAAGGGRVVAVWPDAVLATQAGREAFERWHREVMNAGLLHQVEVRRSDEADS